MAQNSQSETGDQTAAFIAAADASSYGGLRGLLRRYRNMRLGARLALGFVGAFAVVGVLAASGLFFVWATLAGVESFSRRADLTAAAAELEIGLSNLEIAVRDHLAEGDDDSFDDALRRRDGMQAQLRILAAAATGPDVESAAAAAAALDAYWNGFERIVDLKRRRADLTERELPQLFAAVRPPLERLKDVGGVDSAAVVGETSVRVAAGQEMGLRFAERRDMMDGQRSQAAFAEARDRLVELNRYRWAPGVVDDMAAATAAIDALEKALDKLDALAVEQDAVRADTIAPYAALIIEKAQELRGSAEREAGVLRAGLSARAENFAGVVLWTAGVVLALGGLTAWAATLGVVRPVRDATRALTALAENRSGDENFPALPPPSDDRRDEAAALSRAVATVRDDAARMRRALAETGAERDRLAAELRSATASNAAKSDFLVNMGQLLHGPLNEITVRSQELMGELHRNGMVDSANEAEALQWTAERLSGRLDALMDYARIEAGRGELCLQDFDVARLAVEVRERATAQADLHGLTLQAAAGAGGMMHSDFGKVRQSLLNLVENACLHSGGGAVVLTTERIDRDGRPWVVFTVADDGVGLPAERAADLFRPFARGARATGKGAGLGLTLTAHYVAMLGGELEVTTAVRRGARFAVLLPAAYAAEDEDRPLRVRIGEPGGRLPTPQALPFIA